MAYATASPSLFAWPRWFYVCLKTLTVLAAFGGLAGLMWYSYAEGARHGDRRVVPIIRAAAGPIKARPAEPGGVRVPHKDKRVYERIAPQPKRKLADNVERLIPRPEPVAIAPESAKKGAAKSKPQPPTASVPKIKGGPARVRIGIGRQRRVATARRSARKRPKAQQRSGPNAALANAAFRVQIAAYPSPQMAARRWQRLVGKHKDLIGKFDWYVEKVERTNGRAPLYRLQLGPLKNRKAAKELCAKLGKRKVSCLFVRG